jgi:peptidoglycan hydrolase-like protein with peptidoglycan-binding domain
MGNPFVRRSYGYTLPPENLTTGQLSEAQRRDIQSRLNELGYVGRNGQPLVVDGDLGPATGTTSNTRYAIKEFQRRNGLADDGAPGAQTRAVLARDNAVTGPAYRASTSASTPTPTGGEGGGTQVGITVGSTPAQPGATPAQPGSTQSGATPAQPGSTQSGATPAQPGSTQQDTTRRMSQGAIAALVIGGAVLLGGIVILANRPRSNPKKSRRGRR